MSADDLQAQLESMLVSTGTFDATQVQNGEYVSQLEGLGIPTTLALSSALGWQVDGADVTLTGTLGTAVLGVADADVYFNFTPAGDAWVLLIDITLPQSWTFPQSFSLLASSIFSELALDSSHPAALIVASAQAVDDQRTVAGAAITVPTGLSFYGLLDATSPGLALVQWILAGADLPPVNAQIDYAAATSAVSMTLPVATASIASPFGGSPPPDVDLAVSLYSGLNATVGQYVFGVSFAAEIAFGSDNIEVSALLTSSSQPILDLSIAGTALAFPSVTVLDEFFGAGAGNEIADALPAQFNGGNDVTIDGITFGIGLRSMSVEYGFLSVAAATAETWKIWPGVIEIANLNFVFSIFQPLGPAPASSFDFSGVFTLGTVSMLVQAQLPGDRLTGQLDSTQPMPSLAGLVDAVLPNDLPAQLKISKLDFSADIPLSVYSAEIEIDGVWSFPFGTDNEVTFESLALTLAYSAADGPSGSLGGTFVIDGDNVFAIELDMTEQDSTFTGSWTEAGAPLTFQDIAIALGMYGLPNLPDDFDLNLESAQFAFDTEPASFTFELESSYGDAMMVAGQNAAQTAWGYLYAMVVGLNLDIDLTDIPVVGDLVPAGDDIIELSNLRCVAATPVLPQLNNLSKKQKSILGSAVSSGLALSIEMTVGSASPQSFTVAFGGPDDGTAGDTPPSPTGAGAAIGAASDPAAAQLVLAAPDGAAAPPTSASPGPQATWVNVQRSFGPVQINRIGFSLTSDDDLELLLDAGVSLDGLSIQLSGLAATIELKDKFKPTFSLDGLEVQYAAPGLTVGGGLQYQAGSPAEYTGDLELMFGTLGVMADGSYSVADGDEGWSLFVFAFLDVPLGGPPFLLVTGLSGGFGYNRSLELPTIDTVANYPLVKAATGGYANASDVITDLDKLITPEQNEDWFALGIAFTSFEIVQCYGLLTVAFGPNVEIGLIGQGTIAVPPAVQGESNPPPPVAQAQLELLIDIAPSNGVVSACAQLSPSSYVFTPDAKLTGGFAFYLWFDPSQYAGDFVVTLGGYNPNYTPPSYYPTVPLLGLNWKVCSELSIKGGLYFALTPSVIMAGGSFDATWNSFGVKAWFDAAVDFLIRYQPFEFEIDLSINVGASITVDLLVTTVTISVQAGGSLAIYGPMAGGGVGGRCKVDLQVFSVDMTFGPNPSSSVSSIDWSTFSKSFLPPATATAAPQAPATGTVPNTAMSSLITIGAPTGILSTFTYDSTVCWTVSGGALELAISSQIPSTVATIGSQTLDGAALGIGPMDVAVGDLSVTLAVEIGRYIGGAWALDTEDTWVAGATLGSVPTALWANGQGAVQTPALISGALVGVTLVADPPGGATTMPVKLSLLQTTQQEPRPWSWSGAAPQSGVLPQTGAIGQLQSTLTAPTVAAARGDILAALRRQGLKTHVRVDVSPLVTDAGDVLYAAPQLCYTGNGPAAGANPMTADGDA